MNLHLVLLFLHIVGAGVIIGTSVLAVFAVVRPPLTPVSLDRMGFAGRFGMAASIAQLVTGGALMGLEWDELGKSPLVWIKIGLWAIEGALSSMVVGAQVRRVRAALDAGQPPPPTPLTTVFLANLIIVLAIAAIGVFLVSGSEG
jgi:uncharacterized membrane protein